MHEGKRIKVYASQNYRRRGITALCIASKLAALNHQGRGVHTTGVVHAAFVKVNTEAFHLDRQRTDTTCPWMAWTPLLTFYFNHHRPTNDATADARVKRMFHKTGGAGVVRALHMIEGSQYTEIRLAKNSTAKKRQGL